MTARPGKYDFGSIKPGKWRAFDPASSPSIRQAAYNYTQRHGGELTVFIHTRPSGQRELRVKRVR